MVRSRIVLAFAIMFLALTLLPTKSEALTLTTDRTVWEVLVGGYADVDIAGQVAPGVTLTAGTALTLPFAQSLSFDIDLLGYQVGAGWATWSGGHTPAILYSDQESVVATFGGGPVSGFGLEMEPNPFSVYTMSLLLEDGSVVNQDVDGDSGAAFFGWAGGAVVAMSLSCDGCDFAMGRMVIEGERAGVPEPGTLLLLGSGLMGLGYFSRKKRG